MNFVFRVLSYLALGGTVLPAALFFGDRMGLEAVKFTMLVCTIGWFVTAPCWMERREG